MSASSFVRRGPMSRTTGRKRGKTVYVLGAGFSAPAGIPTLATFLPDAKKVLRGNHDDLVVKLDRVQARVRRQSDRGTKYDADNLEDAFSFVESRYRRGVADSAILKEVVVRTLATAHEKRGRLLARGILSDEVMASLVSPPSPPPGYTIDH